VNPSLRRDDWAGEMGDRWLANLDQFESMMQPVGQALLARAAFKPGERVLDIGCGGGDNTRSIAVAVAPSGYVLGLDVSPALIAEAQRRAAQSTVPCIDFLAADAATVVPPAAPFDRLFSRFGVMFFADPPAAFAHLQSLLPPGGRIDFACWAPLADNPWMGALADIVRRHVALPAPPAGEPGPFSLSDVTALRALLSAAGFVDIDCQLWRGPQWLGGQGADAPAALRFALQSMSFSRVVEAQPEPVRQAIADDLLAYLAAHHSSAGIALDASAWLVTAIRPAA
jgi:SAM-dependent methyltransferase